MISFGRGLALALIATCFALPAQAGIFRLEPWRGHVSFGYAHLFSDSTSPGGSISVSGGVDYPFAEGWRIGPTISISLLGTQEVTRGSITAGLDHSLLEAALQVHWLPPSGRITRVSFGPGVAAPRVALQVGAGGAGFLDLAVDEVQPELALDVSAMPRSMTVVAIGLEAGLRWVPVERTNWLLTTVRFTVHY